MLNEKGENCLKINYIGIIAAILAFVSIALPWWTWTATGFDASVNLYQAQATSGGMTIDLTNPPAGKAMNIWYSWTGLALIVISGVLLIAGSVTSMGKKLLLGGSVLALLAIIIFAVGLQMDLTNVSDGNVGLFSAPTGSSAYLTMGFWIALVSAILGFVAIKMQPTETAKPPT